MELAHLIDRGVAWPRQAIDRAAVVVERWLYFWLSHLDFIQGLLWVHLCWPIFLAENACIFLLRSHHAVQVAWNVLAVVEVEAVAAPVMPARIRVCFFRTDRALRGAHLGLLVPAFDFLTKHALLAAFPVPLGISERSWGWPVALIRMVATMVIVVSAATHYRIECVHESVYAVAALTIFYWERLIVSP